MIWDMIKSRLGEASTWKGIISVAAGIGLVSFTDAQSDAIAAAMVSIYAALSIVFPDKFSKKDGGAA